ncbi:MAG: histidine phosphatase family protein [Streptosporangiales bacterium]|nr:histidine phosphatase family protein [Streptosporangiales bacterium]
MAETETAGTRRLVVLRHAKSDWPVGVDDHERPLGARGRKDAPAAGRWLRDTGWPLDHVRCSTAVRARDTWQLAAAELPVPPEAVFDDRVYDASVPALVDVLRAVPQTAGTAVLIGHNPGLQELVLTLAGDPGAAVFHRVQVKFPTSAIAVLTLPGEWAALEPANATLTQLAVPRG